MLLKITSSFTFLTYSSYVNHLVFCNRDFNTLKYLSFVLLTHLYNVNMEQHIINYYPF